MKLRAIFLISAYFLVLDFSFSQCSGGTQSGTISPTSSWQTITNLFAGQYLDFNGITGNYYFFSLCNADGGSASYNSEITILDNNGNYAGGYNDDFCGQQSHLVWNAPANGTYRVLINEVNCQSNTLSTTLAYKTSSSVGPWYMATPITYAPLAVTGTLELDTIDDTWSGVVPISFSFCFYGTSYDYCIVGANQLISFDTTKKNTYNTWPIFNPIPNSSVADIKNSILGPWQDVDPSASGLISYENIGTSPNRKFVVTFDSIAMFSCNTKYSTTQIILFETTNIIEIHIGNKDTCLIWNQGAAIEGIQDQTGDSALVIPGRNYPTHWTAVNDGYRFTPLYSPCSSPAGIEGTTYPANNIAIFPNPSSGSLSIVSSDLILGINIINILGETVYSNTVKSKEMTIAPKIEEGIYFIKMQTSKGPLTKKIIIHR